MIRVALADDQALIRELARAVLEREPDIEVVGDAADGAGLLELVRERSPDVVVLDVSMPGMNGIETAANLAARHPAVKVLALSSHTEREYVSAMFASGAAGYVVKSELAQCLVHAVRTAACFCR